MIFIALLRAVNVGGRNMLPMSGLREVAASVGLEDVKTVLQSGNVLFRAPARSSDKLEVLLERETERRHGISTHFFVRTLAEWSALADANPFVNEAKLDPGHLLVLFAKSEPAAERVEALASAIRGRERVRAAGKQVYAVYPDGVGRSRLTTAVIEKSLGTRVTGRNWNTVLKLRELAGAIEGR